MCRPAARLGWTSAAADGFLPNRNNGGDNDGTMTMRETGDLR
jgi:hypothetical protein